MSRVYLIQDARGERRLGDAALPLRVGGAAAGDIVLPGVAPDALVALLASSAGHAFIQPLDGAADLFHNHERLADSAWLKSGDEIEAGEALLRWTVRGDQVFIQVTRRPPATDLRPPTQPPVAHTDRPLAGVAAVQRPARKSRSGLRYLFAGAFVLLLLGAAFVLLATPVRIEIAPEPDTWSVAGFPPAIPFLGRYLMLPGHYAVDAARTGYQPLHESVAVARGDPREVRLKLQELPGLVRVHTEPEIPFRLLVDGSSAEWAADGVAAIERGVRRLRLEADRYLPLEQELEVKGFGAQQAVRFVLQPAWAEVSIESEPPGARVAFDGVLVGTTPLRAELLQGRHSIVLSLEGHKPVTLHQDVIAGHPLSLTDILLPPADGLLSLTSEPRGATVTIDGNFLGTTPLQHELAAAEEHRIRLSKPGFAVVERSLSLAAEEQRELHLSLPAEYGVVFLSSQPADADLVIDGRSAGKATQRLRLTTRPHRLRVVKSGYAPRELTLTPTSGVSQSVEIELKTMQQAKLESTPGVLTTHAGQRLRLVRPGDEFEMGASRRDAGRRANESRRLVQLTRAFYLAEREVTNQEFRLFRASHDSAAAEGLGLDADSQPAVMVTWDEAARYCNWLSRQDGLPPAYHEVDGQMRMRRPVNTGYRLPTEAEWTYAARLHGRSEPARYPWPGQFPPSAVVGNFADRQIADTLAEVVPGYDDGYRVAAPVGSFDPGPGGFFDLGGNVAEWTNDHYAVYPGEAASLVRDPLGPEHGEHHVVRGSSWRHGNITELRLSYRDYSRAGRDDLGFRVARYAE